MVCVMVIPFNIIKRDIVSCSLNVKGLKFFERLISDCGLEVSQIDRNKIQEKTE